MTQPVGPNIAPAAAELTPDPNFEAQLEHAFEHPLIVTLTGSRKISPEEIAEREAYYSRQRELPDTSPVRIGTLYREDYEALTFESHKFALLIAQAMRRLEIVQGHPDPGIVVTPEIQASAEHEATHGRMSQRIGVDCVYSVRVLHDPEANKWAVGPAHNPVGPATITKLESAAISVAPEDASEGDLLSAYAAGYTSRQEVLEKFYTSHPDIAPASK